MTYSVFYSRGEFFTEVHASTPNALRQKVEEIDKMLSEPMIAGDHSPIIGHPTPSVLREMHRDGPNPLPRDLESRWRPPPEWGLDENSY